MVRDGKLATGDQWSKEKGENPRSWVQSGCIRLLRQTEIFEGAKSRARAGAVHENVDLERVLHPVLSLSWIVPLTKNGLHGP